MTTFKELSSDDKVSTKTLLHEAIPITGTILSGTYDDNNIQDFAHGMFQSVYDYPYLSSSANHIFDISFGFHGDSGLYTATTTDYQKEKKKNIYNQMAQVLMGYDKDGNILKCDRDGDLVETGGKLDYAYFLSFSRLLSKDEIKKGSFQIELLWGSAFATPGTSQATIKDYGADTSYKVNSPAGEYGILYITGSGVYGSPSDGEIPCGLIY